MIRPLALAAPSFALLAGLATTLAPAPALADPVWHEAERTKDIVALPSLAPLVEEMGPAVLTISVEGTSNAGQKQPLFRGFGMEFDAPPMPLQGQGSGFIIHESGYALTNYHVVENADVIKVKAGGAREEYDAEVVGTDRKTDVALIYIKSNGKKWPYTPLGDSDALRVGDFVVAIGNPFGLSQTVSTGIISANHRRNIAPSGRQGLYDFLQTDASINPGNSGGPLLNLRGEVIGINAAVNRAGQGLGFAIPINLVKEMLPQLKNAGSVVRSWIGIGIQEITPDIASGLGLSSTNGALIAQVVPSGPAERAGLRPGDVVLEFNREKVHASSDLPLMAAHAGVGKKIPVAYWRDGKAHSTTVTLGRLPTDTQAQNSGAGPAIEGGKLGLRVKTLDEATRNSLGLRREMRGAFVAEVAPGSVGARSGIRRGDIIFEVNKRTIKSAQGFVRTVAQHRRGGMLNLLIKRGTQTIFVPVKKP